MPSGWEVYYVVFLSALFALVIPLSLKIISSLMGGGRKAGPGSEQSVPPPRPFEIAPGRLVNPRFFLGANFALGMIALVLVLLPCVVTVADKQDHAAARGAWLSVLTLSGFAALGLIYAFRKGDLNWLRSYHSGSKDEELGGKP